VVTQVRREYAGTTVDLGPAPARVQRYQALLILRIRRNPQRNRYAGGMSQPSQDVRDETERVLAGAGIVVTDEGKARARTKLRAAEERMTPDVWARLDERYGRNAAA
jgi:hypothetical protein